VGPQPGDHWDKFGICGSRLQGRRSEPARRGPARQLLHRSRFLPKASCVTLPPRRWAEYRGRSRSRRGRTADADWAAEITIEGEPPTWLRSRTAYA